MRLTTANAVIIPYVRYWVTDVHIAGKTFSNCSIYVLEDVEETGRFENIVGMNIHISFPAAGKNADVLVLRN